MLNSLKSSKLQIALSPASFKTIEQRDAAIAYLSTLKTKKPSNKPVITEAEKMVKAEKARRARMAAKKINSSTQTPTSLFADKPAEPTIVQNKNASHKFGGYRKTKKNARKILIGCPVEGSIDSKGRIVENVTVENSNIHYNSVVFNAEAQIDPDHSSISKCIAYGDPALLCELLAELR